MSFLSRLNPFKKKFVLNKSAPTPIVIDIKADKEARIVEVLKILFKQVAPQLYLEEVLLDGEQDENYQADGYTATICFVKNNAMAYISIRINKDADIESPQQQAKIAELIELNK